MHLYSRNGGSAYGRNSSSTQTEHEFSGTEGRRIHKSVPQPAGEYGLEEYNTYYKDGLDVVEDNYEEMFSDTNVGIAFHRNHRV